MLVVFCFVFFTASHATWFLCSLSPNISSYTGSLRRMLDSGPTAQRRKPASIRHADLWLPVPRRSHETRSYLTTPGCLPLWLFQRIREFRVGCWQTSLSDAVPREGQHQCSERRQPCRHYWWCTGYGKLRRLLHGTTATQQPAVLLVFSGHRKCSVFFVGGTDKL